MSKYVGVSTGGYSGAAELAKRRKQCVDKPKRSFVESCEQL